MVFHPEDNQKKRILFVQCAQEVSVRRSEDSRRGAVAVGGCRRDHAALTITWEPSLRDNWFFKTREAFID